MRSALLAVLGADVALVAAGVIGYPAFLGQRGSVAYLAGPVVLLAVYAVLVLAATRSASVDRRRVLRTAALVGLALGALETVNISVETFTGLSGAANLATTAPLILGPFLVWSVVAGWAARASRSLGLGLLAAVWCAMVTMVIGVTYGFVLANTFDNGFTHLLGGLIVASVVGLIGSLIGTRLAHPRQPQRDRPDHIRPVSSVPTGTESAT